MRERLFDLLDLHRVEAADCQKLAAALEGDRRGPADQSHRPLERMAGDDVSIRAEEQQILHEHTQALLFGGSPLAAEPRRRREADKQEGHDEQNDQLDHDADRWIARQRSGRNGE